MVKLNWEGSANGEQDVYILIAQRMSALKLIGKIHLIRRLVNDKESGLTFSLHIQDSKLRDPLWVISDVYGYKNYNDVKLCRVKFSDQKWWAIKLPKGSFTGLEEVFFDGGVVNPDYLRWIVKDTGWIVVEDCKSWSSSFSLTSDPNLISFTETDPVFKAHPSYTITQAQINEFHKAVTLNPDLINGLVLVEQSLGLNLANYESAGAMSPEDKLKLDQLEVGEYYPLNENPAGYLTEEKDPLFRLSPAYLIKSTDIARWNDAYYWGNHANYGYLTSFTETDPIFRSSPAYNINYGQINQWNEFSNRSPIHKTYTNIPTMLAEQDEQVAGYIYYTVDSKDHWEYLGISNGLLSDYRIISEKDKNYVHTQNTPSNIWSIVHNLNKFPSVTVIDTGNNEVIGEVDYINTNELTISFVGSFTGKATLN